MMWALVWATALPAFAQTFSITQFGVEEGGGVQITHESDGASYYILYRGSDLFTISAPRALHLGAVASQQFNDSAPGQTAVFYRILKIPQSQPRDVDGDGIDDLYELRHPGILNALNSQDATLDSDSDGISNLEEYRRGTDPAGGGGGPILLTAPDSNSTFNAPSDIALSVAGVDAATVRVEYFAGSTLVATGTSSPFSAVWRGAQPGDYDVRAEAVTAAGARRASGVAKVVVNIQAPILGALPAATPAQSIVVRGQALAGSRVEIDGGLEQKFVTASGTGSFEINLPLRPNRLNRLFVRCISTTGRTSPLNTVDILQDAQPPTLFVDFPPNNSEVSAESVVIAGRVGDLLSGFMGLGVKVGGETANVVVGIGPNGTFERPSVPLVLGRNVIQVTATDEHGNATSRELVLNRIELGGAVLKALSGDGQKGPVHNPLPEPVAVQVQAADGSPMANKVVSFEVVRSDGRLKTSRVEAGQGQTSVQITTDSAGIAAVFWVMGSDAGCGNNRLSVKSKDISGTVFFCASATPQPASQINIGTGNNQIVEAGSFATEALRAWVNDSCNGVPNLPVTFTVLEGDGLLYETKPAPGAAVAGRKVITVNSVLTGHSSAFLQLGPGAGVNVVSANFAGNKTDPAVFRLTGLARAASGVTSLSGVVLDNAEAPVGGARCTLQAGGRNYVTTSDRSGNFQFTDIPSGSAHLHVEGLLADTRSGEPIAQGTYPALAYTLALIPNTKNVMPAPVLLPRLNPQNARIYDGTHDVVLTCEGISGLRMIVKAGSMRRPDGTAPNPSNPAVLALNQVHHDDIPMPMPDGASPPFAWTLQPAGSTFDPPIRIEYPNMSGLPAGAIAYFLSFNHDTERFEIVASGHVLKDGSKIVSDPGVGLSLAGWGCNCPPYSVTGGCGNCN